MAKIIFLLATIAYTINYLLHPDFSHLIDSVNLVIHESGHTILFFTGDYLRTLGGTLFQILIPTLFAFYFLRRQDYYAASILLTWVGINFISVSIYLGDAVTMAIPLLGGDDVIHDWNYLLSVSGWLPYTATIAHIIYGIGLAIIIVSFIIATISIFQNKQRRMKYEEIR